MSYTLGGKLICRTLLCGRHRQIHKIFRFRSTKWDTVDVYLPIMPNIFLPRLYCRCAHRLVYILLSLSSADLIIPHLFCFPHCLASMAHIFWCRLNLPMYLLPYLLPSLSAAPVISIFCFLCNYQPDTTLNFPPDILYIIPHICLRHPCYPTYLPRLCCHCLHHSAYILLPYPLLHVSSDSVYIIPHLCCCFNQQ